MVHRRWKVRWTVQISADESADRIREEIAQIGEVANDLLDNMIPGEEGEFELVETTAEKLGLPCGGTQWEIYLQAFERGLDRCPARVAPKLRAKYENQPMDDLVLVAMDPIGDEKGVPHIFALVHDASGCWLSVRNGHPELRWPPNRKWVFARRRTSVRSVLLFF